MRNDIFSADGGSQVNFIGTEFFLDGAEVEGLIVGEPFTVDHRNVTLSGLLADASPFSFELNSRSSRSPFFSQDATLTLTLVLPEPSGVAQAIAATLLSVGFGRNRAFR